MDKKIERKTINIGGMSCINCQTKIEKTLNGTAGITSANVDYKKETASIEWDSDQITLDEISATIENLGYTFGNKQKTDIPRALYMLTMIVAIFMFLQHFGFIVAAGGFPLAESGMAYGMLFVLGLITSVHCVAMCGGINLSQCLKAGGSGENRNGTKCSEDFVARGASPHLIISAPILYNSGRVISYTVVGFIVGALGSVFSFSNTTKAFIQLAAGIFMLVMGINMLGIFPVLKNFSLNVPKSVRRYFSEKTKSAKSKSPLYVGLLNGLMPCGPLQAMQLYALGSGSALLGAISMFLFSAGTVPLMFGLGALSSVLSGKFTKGVMTVGAIIVAVMGLSMLSYGWNLGGFISPNILASNTASNSSGIVGAKTAQTTGDYRIENGVQYLSSSLQGGRYPQITVQVGLPVKWNIIAPPGSINGCNNRMIIREYGIEHSFKTGDNIIEFTPQKTGTVRYSCWMGMIRSSINVIDGEVTAGGGTPNNAAEIPSPAAYVIPTEQALIADIVDGIQNVNIKITDNGIEPALVVLQKGVLTQLTIENTSLDSGSDELIFPAYYTKVPIIGGNTINLKPVSDFDFSTGDNIFYGYIKVVNDINNIDLEAIKKEVSEFETLIYPQTYFEAASGNGGNYASGSCCMGILKFLVQPGRIKQGGTDGLSKDYVRREGRNIPFTL